MQGILEVVEPAGGTVLYINGADPFDESQMAAIKSADIAIVFVGTSSVIYKMIVCVKVGT